VRNPKNDFDPFIRVHQGAIRSFLRRLCGSEALADDLAQDCFVKAYQKWSAVRSKQTARTWLYGIAYRCFIDHYRKDKRRGGLLDSLPTQSSPPHPDYTRLDLEAAMNSLSPDCRACIILCLAHGYTIAEAAKITNMPQGTIKSHLSRGKKHLQTFLSAYEVAK